MIRNTLISLSSVLIKHRYLYFQVSLSKCAKSIKFLKVLLKLSIEFCETFACVEKYGFQNLLIIIIQITHQTRLVSTDD